ncbi:hypothetical protein [Streptomyces sp. NPDC056468]|uniref:hypothetical protein n=1 Tax=Streptomyces sp. NPDC056468 TaxID=3345830 RepID=UPI003690DE1C
MTGHEGRAGDSRASRIGTCARSGLFAVLGTLLATFGHHAIADGAVPWRLVGTLIAAQFAAAWPLARRRYTPAATLACTLATQGALHLALSYADSDATTGMAGHDMHAGHVMAGVGDGHAWHHAGTAMTTVHVVSALVGAWLLHRTDTRISAAVGALGTLAKAAVAAVSQVLPRQVRSTGRMVFALPGQPLGASFEAVAQAGDDVLEHAVVRRGPPRREHLQPVTRSQ